MPKIVVEGPDGKKYAFPDTMPREEINAFMKQRYGTKARNETVQDYLARVVREQDATKARARDVTREATATGRAEGERAAERMGVDNPLMMAFAAPAIGLAQQSAGRTVYDREGTMLPDEAAALAAVNAAGFLVPGMVNRQFGERAAEGRRQQPGASFAGDLAGGAIGGEMISLGLQKAGQAIAPGVSAIGRMFKRKPAPEPPLTLGPESRIMPVDRPDAFPGDDVAMAQALDQWTPPVEQQVRPMGMFGGGSGGKNRDPWKSANIEEFVNAQISLAKPKRIERAATQEEWDAAVEGAQDLMERFGKRGDVPGQRPQNRSTENLTNPDARRAYLWEDLAAAQLRSRGLDPDPVFMPLVARRQSNAERETVRQKIAPTVSRVIGRDGPKREPFKPTIVKPPPDVVPSVTISPEERAMLTGQPATGKTRTVGAKEIPAPQADPEYDAARKLARLTPEEIATLLSKTDDDVTPSGFGGRVAKREKRNEPFYDDRLTPSENKAVEMRRNGYSASEIADEMDTSEGSVYAFFRTAKQKGVELKVLQKDTQTADILALTEKGLPPRVISERLGIPRGQVNVVLSKARKALGEELPDWLKPQKGGRPMGILTERGRDAVEQTFGAAYMSGTGSVAGQQYDFNGDGQIDDTDIAIGSGIGLAAFASPLALRKVAELGGRLKGTKARAGDDINPAGFDASRPRVAKRETRNESFFDDRLTPSENKAVEMRKNGYTIEEIADEMDTSRKTVDQFLFKAKAKGVEIGAPTRDRRADDVLELAKKGLSNKQIEDRLGLNPGHAKVFLSRERDRLRKAGEELPDWLAPKVPPRGGGRPKKEAD